MPPLEQPATRYDAATACLCLLPLVGTWLPWVENTSQYLNGEPYVTAIGLAGMGSGSGSSFDSLVFAGLVPAIGGALVFRRWNWLRDACTCLSGVLLCWWVGGLAYAYEGVIELFSHRDDRASRIVSTFVVGDRDDKAKAQREEHLRSCVDAASGVGAPEAAVLH